MSIINAKGRIVNEYKFLIFDNKFNYRIYTETLASGYYFVEIECDGIISFKNIIVLHGCR